MSPGALAFEIDEVILAMNDCFHPFVNAEMIKLSLANQIVKLTAKTLKNDFAGKRLLERVPIEDFMEIRKQETEYPKLISRLIKALDLLKRGECFCEVGIGNPMYGGSHTSECQAVSNLLTEARMFVEGKK